MQIARLAALAILVKRRPIRKVTRASLCWELDLREGIDLSIYLTGYFQRRVTRQILANLPATNATFIDVGCNRGAISIPVASRRPDCQIIAIDPVPEVLNKLIETQRLNPLIDNIVPVCEFLSSSAAVTTSDVPKVVDASWNVFSRTWSSDSSCASPLATGVARSVSLDALCERRALVNIAVIKIDVDGFELEVLKGAVETLHRWAPILIIEWAPGSLLSRGTRLEDLSGFIDRLGYQPWRIQLNGKVIPIDWSDLIGLRRGEACELLLKRISDFV